MTQDEFVIEEAGDKTILVRHSLAGVRFLFVMKDRKFAGAAGNEPKPSDLRTLRTITATNSLNAVA